MEQPYDYIIIGSGFGGSVSALRLAEKGYSVLVLEKGKRFMSEDFPTSDWYLNKFIWWPRVRWFGFQKLNFFRRVTILSGVGVGGGSLVYGNTHMFPPDAFFANTVWSHFRNWKDTLLPYYDTARKMLGSRKLTILHDEDNLLREVATEMGRDATFDSVNAGVHFGDTEIGIDPYFGGKGPLRTGCRGCAGCMVGCRYNAKNTLDKNYLHLAELLGVTVMDETLAEKIEYIDGKYMVQTTSSTSWFRKHKKSLEAYGLVVSGGVLGTLDLLLKQKYKYRTLPLLSDQLGDNVLTNSESLCGVSHADRKLNNGVAISSYFNPDDHTHIEVVKYNDTSGALGRLATLAVGSGNGFTRTMKWIGAVIHQPWKFLRLTFGVRNWGKNTVIFLVMQSLHNSMRLEWKKGLLGGGMSFKNDKHMRVPAFIPIGQEVMMRYAKKVSGIAQNNWPEIVLNMPMTAHILGGCPMGHTKATGVVNDKFEVHGYNNMLILDGSIMPCNLGVNPSLTITALAEYAMDQIQIKKEKIVK